MTDLLTAFFKKNSNTFFALTFFALAILGSLTHTQNITITLGGIVVGLTFLIDNLRPNYRYLQGINLILYGTIILFLRRDLWAGAITCTVLGLVSLTFFIKQKMNK